MLTLLCLNMFFLNLTYLFLVKQFRLGPIFKHDFKSIYEEISLNQIKSKYLKGNPQIIYIYISFYLSIHIYNDRAYFNDNYEQIINNNINFVSLLMCITYEGC